MKLELRPFQIEALRALESPGHLVCVSRTGSGKSLIYERSASLPGRRTLLVSPLVALAHQQREKLRASGLRAVLTSGGGSERPDSRTQVWIVSPEALRSERGRNILANWRPDFLVVDECHCLWEWGEGFRPDFADLPDLIPRWQIRRSLWLTATLPREARRDLRNRLPMPLRELGRFELPPGLHLTVRRAEWRDRCDALGAWVRGRDEHGIVFTSTREQAVRVSRWLASRGHAVSAYHAGLSREERRAVEARVAQRTSGIVVATSAFGMGMDHPHLSWVALWQAPSSLLAMTQAIGRVGRFAGRGHALVLWDFEDFRLLNWIVQGSDRRGLALRDVHEFLKSIQCRRRALDLHFEGESFHIRGPDCCDFCDANST